MIWHVTPTNDLKQHQSGHSLWCHCNPYVEKQPNGNILVTHFSYDAREFHEIEYAETQKHLASH